MLALRKHAHASVSMAPPKTHDANSRTASGRSLSALCLRRNSKCACIVSGGAAKSQASHAAAGNHRLLRRRNRVSSAASAARRPKAWNRGASDAGRRCLSPNTAHSCSWWGSTKRRAANCSGRTISSRPIDWRAAPRAIRRAAESPFSDRCSGDALVRRTTFHASALA